MRYLVCNELGTPFFNNLVKQTELLKRETSHFILGVSNMLNLSTYYFMRGESWKSLEILDWGISIYKDKDELKIEKCKILILEQKYLHAQHILDTLQRPHCTHALYERAKMALLLSKPEQAVSYLKDIIKAGVSRDQLLIELTFFLATNHMMYLAKDCWDEISADAKYTYDYRLSCLALEYELGQYEKAYRHSKLFFHRYPNDIAACFYCTELTFRYSGIRSIRCMAAHSNKLHASSSFVQHINKQLTTILDQRSSHKRGNNISTPPLDPIEK